MRFLSAFVVLVAFGLLVGCGDDASKGKTKDAPATAPKDKPGAPPPPPPPPPPSPPKR